MLIPAHQTMVIPVSCVESGRWRHTSREFAAAPRVQYAEGRAAKMQNVTASLRSDSSSRRSNQGEVWNLIAEKASRLDASSPTSAMSSMYEVHGGSIDEFVKAFTPVERQVGAVFFINGRVAGLELFDAASTWRAISPKLVRSYAIDAIDRPPTRSNAVTGIGDGLLHGAGSEPGFHFSRDGDGRRRPPDRRPRDGRGAGGRRPRDARQRVSAPRGADSVTARPAMKSRIASLSSQRPGIPRSP